MPEVEANAGVGRAFVRREVLAKRREALLEAAPSRSQANLEIRVPARNRHEEYERNRDAAEIAALKARLQNHETLQSQWKLAQEELAVQKQARVTEAARMADRVSQLESEIESVS
ncbi:MAG TPA: hypothetical protein VHC72_07035, partial [Bryobacteraceae bacterium]|nr:hypothetical protein [Bryobacteraceae bacterium]